MTCPATMAQTMMRLVPPVARGLGGYVSKRTRIYGNKKDVSRDLITKIQQNIDLRPIAIRRWKKEKLWQQLVEDHQLNQERLDFLGPDLATAHFIIARGGAIRFDGIDRWFEPNKEGKVPRSVPNTKDPRYLVEAVDASETPIMYSSFDNFGKLSRLRYLALRRCPNITDWCMDRLIGFSDTLQVLDLSGCPKVTERGLGALHKMSNLRRLILSDMPNVHHKSLVAVMLEEVMPNCVIEGVDFSQPTNTTSDVNPGEIVNSGRDAFENYEKQLYDALIKDRDAGVVRLGGFNL